MSISTMGEQPVCAMSQTPLGAARTGWPVPVANSVRALRPRQAQWAVVNLGIIALVLLLQFVPASGFGAPPRRIVGIFALAAVMQSADLLWLLWRGLPLAPRAGLLHFKLTLGFNVLLALVLATCSPLADIQYGLLVLPAVIAIAFRYGLWAGVGFSLLTGVLSFLPLEYYVIAHPAARASAMRDGAVLAASYVIVAIVVDILCGAVRDEAARLRRSLRELWRTKEQLIAQEKLAAVGRLSAAIAHEIRNPVAMIASSLELAAEPATPVNIRNDMSQIALDESARLTRLTNDFLAYARGMPPQRTSLAVRDVLGAVAALVTARACEAGVALAVTCSSELRADLDELQIHQALLNLVINAVEASPHGATVTVGGRSRPEGGVELWVENAGHAIAPDAAARLFEPFFTTKPRGSGLGLPIARKIAIAHGGDLVLERNEPGSIRFVLQIPGRANQNRGATHGPHPDC